MIFKSNNISLLDIDQLIRKKFKIFENSFKLNMESSFIHCELLNF